MTTRTVEYFVHTKWREPEEVTVVKRESLRDAQNYAARRMTRSYFKTDVIRVWITKRITNVIETEVN